MGKPRFLQGPWKRGCSEPRREPGIESTTAKFVLGPEVPARQHSLSPQNWRMGLTQALAPLSLLRVIETFYPTSGFFVRFFFTLSLPNASPSKKQQLYFHWLITVLEWPPKPTHGNRVH